MPNVQRQFCSLFNMKAGRSQGSYLGDELSRKIRKSASCEPIMDGLSSDDEEYLIGKLKHLHNYARYWYLYFTSYIANHLKRVRT